MPYRVFETGRPLLVQESSLRRGSALGSLVALLSILLFFLKMPGYLYVLWPYLLSICRYHPDYPSAPAFRLLLHFSVIHLLSTFFFLLGQLVVLGMYKWQHPIFESHKAESD